jgi:predicted RecA/RadA family phage recombinase
MANNFIQPGHVIQHSPAAAVSSGDVVVIGNILGVALSDIAASASGQVQITGVFSCPKASAAVIKAGETLTWDVSAVAFDDNAATPATGDVTGAAAIAFADAGAGTTTLAVKFTGVPGTVT